MGGGLGGEFGFRMCWRRGRCGVRDGLVGVVSGGMGEGLLCAGVRRICLIGEWSSYYYAVVKGESSTVDCVICGLCFYCALKY